MPLLVPRRELGAKRHSVLSVKMKGLSWVSSPQPHLVCSDSLYTVLAALWVSVTVWAGAGAHQLVRATLGSRPCATKALARGPETAVWATLWPES